MRLRNWADARLLPDPAARRRVANAPVDIASFANVVTSNPNRMTGTAATRVQEFPAKDVFLDTELKPEADGVYAVPTITDEPACIGLRWYEKRSLQRLELQFADTPAPTFRRRYPIANLGGRLPNPILDRLLALARKMENAPNKTGTVCWRLALENRNQ